MNDKAMKSALILLAIGCIIMDIAIGAAEGSFWAGVLCLGIEMVVVGLVSVMIIAK